MNYSYEELMEDLDIGGEIGFHQNPKVLYWLWNRKIYVVRV